MATNPSGGDLGRAEAQPMGTPKPEEQVAPPLAGHGLHNDWHDHHHHAHLIGGTASVQDQRETYLKLQQMLSEELQQDFDFSSEEGEPPATQMRFDNGPQGNGGGPIW